MWHQQCPWCPTYREGRRPDERLLHPEGSRHSREADGGAATALENDSPARRSVPGLLARSPIPAEPGAPPRSGGRSAPRRSTGPRRRGRGSSRGGWASLRPAEVLLGARLTSLVELAIGDRPVLRLPLGDRR